MQRKELSDVFMRPSEPIDLVSVLWRQSVAKRALPIPGVTDALTARLAQSAGFECLYFSGSAFANMMGLPDLGLFTSSELADAVHRITPHLRAPLIVDGDTGFGEAVNVARAVADLERAGAAAVHIEDQVLPKRCGHLDGKELIPAEEMMKKIATARRARRRMLVIARTDARAVEGFDAAVSRARQYAKAGADIVFPEALESAEEFEEFACEVRTPLIANQTEFGKSPFLERATFARFGYSFVLFPLTAFRAMLKTAATVYREVHDRGTQAGMLDQLLTRRELQVLVDYDEYEEFDRDTARLVAELTSGA
jgi:methylisocitrate lyase